MNKKLLSSLVLWLIILLPLYSQPTILQYPQDSYVCPESSVTLSVTASCGVEFCFLSYQWYYQREYLGAPATEVEIPGETSSSLTISYGDISYSTEEYKVKVTSTTGWVKTNWATVTKTSSPYSPTGISVDQPSSCPGSPAILTRQGDLQTGAWWTWYTGSCGGTEVDRGSSLGYIYPTETTTYYLRQENACGVSNCVEVTVEVSDLSSAATGITPAKAAVCPREETTLTVEGGSLGTGARWAWYADECQGDTLGFGSSINISQDVESIYYVRAEGVCDTTDCASLTLSLETTPEPPGVTNLDFCEGETVAISATGTDITWYADNQLATQLATSESYEPGITEPGSYTYYVTQTGTKCESNPDSVKVAIYEIPVQPVSEDRYGCIGGLIPDLTAEGTNLTWYTDPQLQNPVNTGSTFVTGKDQAGTHTWYITQTVNNCESPSDTVKLFINNTPSKPAAGDVSICFGVTGTVLSATGTDIKWYSDPGPSSLVYTGTEFTPDEIISGEHKWYVTQTVNNCESPPDTSVLFIKDQIPDPIAEDVGICSDETVPALTSSGQNITWYADAGLTILVQTGTSFTPGVTDPGTYTWYLVDRLDECSSKVDSVSLAIITYPDAPVCSDIQACFGEDIPDLTATGSDVKWFSDAGLTALAHLGNTFTSGKTQVGTYKWYVIQANGKCNSSTSIATLKIKSVPAANVIPDSEICEGESIDIGSYSIDGHSYAWRLQNSTTIFSEISNPGITPETTSTYILAVTLDSTACTNQDSVTITVNPPPDLDMVFENNPVPAGENTIIHASGAVSYQWSPATGLSATTGSTVTASPENDTEYTLSGTSDKGCSGSISKALLVSCQRMCGDTTMFDPQGHFNHGCSEHGYNNNTSCSWTIAPTGTVEIYLYFHPDSFDIQPGDWLRVYNGSSAEEDLLAEYNNQQPPPASTPLEAGSTVFVQFTSDSATTGKGFQARYDISPNTVGEIKPEKIKLYPNPAGRILYIEWDVETARQAEVFIYNSLGQLEMRKTINVSGIKQINIEDINPGVYYLKLVSGNKITRRKFIKE